MRPNSLMAVRIYLRDDYKLTPRQVRRLTWQFIEQLASCETEAARRLILGVSR